MGDVAVRDRGVAGVGVIKVGGGLKVLLATEPVDLRRGVHGLAALVAQALDADPYRGAVFVFRSKRSERLKLIAWDGSGMVLVTKWLEAGRFTCRRSRPARSICRRRGWRC